MNYAELRQALIDHADDPAHPDLHPDAVYFARYDGESRGRWLDTWNIRESGGRFEVGPVERGSFEVEHVFDTEEEACDWLFAHLSQRRPATVVPAAEIEEAKRRMRARLDADGSGPPSRTAEEG